MRRIVVGLVGLVLGAVHAQEVVPNIPIAFTLATDGHVTIVLEDGDGHRVRNLIGGAFHPAGSHTYLWDGYDEGIALAEEAYDIERSLVAAGEYTVRVLTHEGLALRTEVRVNTEGDPPWKTEDGSGAWLADHSPPVDVVALPAGSPFDPVPQVFVGSHTDEAGHGNVWLDLDGRKIFGFRQGGFVAPWAAARDVGSLPDPTHHLYRAVPDTVEDPEDPESELKVMTIAGYTDSGGLVDLYSTGHLPNGTEYRRTSGMSIAVYDGVAVLSLPHDDTLELVDLSAGTRLSSVAAVDPRGVLVDPDGRLYAVIDGEVRTFDVDWSTGALSGEQTWIATDLVEPFRLARDASGRLYVSDHGTSHQVKVFDSTGAPLFAIGREGDAEEEFGLYDEQKMRYPGGLAIDELDRVWVAEISVEPKRVSLWNVDGTFVRAFYGPSPYGGGGYLDPEDPTRFYLTTRAARDVLREFVLDWQEDTCRPRAIWDLKVGLDPALTLPAKRGDAEQPIHVGGHVYLSDAYMQNQSFSRPRAMLWLYGDGTTQPRLCAIVGSGGNGWDELQRPDVFAVWSEQLGIASSFLYFVWSDENLNGVAELEEFQFAELDDDTGRQAIDHDLGLSQSNGYHVPAPTVLDNGVPVWDLEGLVRLYVNDEAHGDVVTSPEGWTVVGGGPLYGYDPSGAERWLYHSQNGQFGTGGGPPRWPGDVGAGTARMIGFTATPDVGDAGEIWAINGKSGEIFLFTVDGFYLGELGAHDAVFPLLRLDDYSQGQLLSELSFKNEHFWPSGLTQTSTGDVYLVAGKEFSEVFAVVGLDTVVRAAPTTVTVTAEQQAGKPSTITVPAFGIELVTQVVELTDDSITVDGDLSEWDDEQFLTVDVHRGIDVAVEIAGDRLYAAFRTGDPELLDNSGLSGYEELFNTGGGLDLFVRTDTSDVESSSVLGGDFRVFVTRTGNDPADGPVAAARYQQVATWAGGGAPYTYQSPVREVAFESVADVGDLVELGQSGGDYELSMPLSVLGGLLPEEGVSTRADVGVILGDGFEPQVRLYLSNKFAVPTSDVPSEAELRPEFWGYWSFTGTLPELSVDELREEFVTGASADIFVHDDGVSTKYPIATGGSGTVWAASSPFTGTITRSIQIRDHTEPGEHDYVATDRKLCVVGTYYWGVFNKRIDLSAPDARIVYEHAWPTGRPQPSTGVSIRHLLRVEEADGAQWYLSTAASAVSVADYSGEGDVRSVSVDVAHLSWEKVASTVDDNLDDMTVGPTEDMATEPGEPASLAQVSGGGIYWHALGSKNDGYYPYAVVWDSDGLDACPLPAPTGEVDGLTVDRAEVGVQLSWLLPADATTFDVVGGDLALLLATEGDYEAATDTCWAADHASETLELTDDTGNLRWFLVRGRSCGGVGSYDSGGLSQVAPRDAGIDGSTSSCPPD